MEKAGFQAWTRGGAHLATLRRSVSGKFDVADATPLDAVLNLTAAELEKRVIPFLKLAAA